MQIEEIIGKTVTNIYSLVKMEVGGLDNGECFIELDNNIIIELPFGFSDDVWIKDLDKGALSLFADLSDYTIYNVNENNKTVGKIANNYQRQRQSIFNKLRRILFGQENGIKEYQPYKVDYKENKLKYIKDRTIIDFLWYENDNEKGFILLDNGYLITETNVAPNGTGLVGLNFYENLNDLTNSKGNNYFKLTDLKGIH